MSCAGLFFILPSNQLFSFSFLLLFGFLSFFKVAPPSSKRKKKWMRLHGRNIYLRCDLFYCLYLFITYCFRLSFSWKEKKKKKKKKKKREEDEEEEEEEG